MHVAQLPDSHENGRPQPGAPGGLEERLPGLVLHLGGLARRARSTTVSVATAAAARRRHRVDAGVAGDPSSGRSTANANRSTNTCSGVTGARSSASSITSMNGAGPQR